MAGPFNIQTSLPGDTDIVSQYPANERTNRTTINNWLLVDHDSNTGQHLQINLNVKADPASVLNATTAQIWVDANGQIRKMWGGTGRGGSGSGNGVVEMLEVPPGAVLPYAPGGLPAGYLWCNGQAVSRTTYAYLFAIVGANYGAGDGSTTFNVPDLRNRTVYGVDGATMGGVGNSNRLSSVSGFGNNNTPGQAGGIESINIGVANLPSYNLSASSVSSSVSSSSSSSSTSIFNAATGIALVSNTTGITALFKAAATGVGGATDTAANAGIAGSFTGAVSVSDPGHTHSVSDPQHTHSASTSTSTSTSTTTTTTTTVSSGGSGTVLGNVGPAMLMFWIIKF